MEQYCKHGLPMKSFKIEDRMKNPHVDVESFVITIHVEHTERSQASRWYGYITHVETRQRQYFGNLSDLRAFIVSHLKRVGLHFGVIAVFKQSVLRKLSRNSS
jgi:hypothetical protein